MGAITIKAKLNYNVPITAKELNIVFNGVVYENVPRIEDAEIHYGSKTFSEYPFDLVVESNLDGIWLYTNTAGEYTISVSIPGTETVTTTPCFDKARGYSCTETAALLTDESVTTNQEEFGNVGGFAYSTPITADTIRVTFNGVEYICDAVVIDETTRGYGGAGQSDLDFSEYPFAILSNSNPDALFVNTLYTEIAGTYQVKIEAVEESVETSECFKKAVESVAGASPSEKSLAVHLANDTFDTTADEIVAAITQGTTVFVYAQYGEFGGQVLSYNYEDRQNKYSFYLINGATIVRYSGIGGNSFPSLQS